MTGGVIPNGSKPARIVEFPIPTCNTMSELVTDYLEGDLPLRTRMGVRIHLFACRACDNYYGQMRQTVRLVRRGVPRPLAESVEEKVLARLANPPHGQMNGHGNGDGNDP